jgi:YVTN family beta-propeller protein
MCLKEHVVMLSKRRRRKPSASSIPVTFALFVGLLTGAGHGVAKTENADPGLRSPVASANGGELVFVVNRSRRTVAVLDKETRAVLHEIVVGNRPTRLALAPDGKHLYVTVTGRRSLDRVLDGSVASIDLKTMSVDAQIPLGYSPNGIVVTPDGRWAYVSDGGGATVHVLDLSSFTLSQSLQSAHFDTPSGMDISPDGAYVYVANIGFVNDRVGLPSAPENISVIRTADNTVVGMIDLSGEVHEFGPWDVTVLPDGSRAYSNDGDDGTKVFEIDTDPRSSTFHSLTGQIGLGAGEPGPRGMESGHTPNGVRVFVGAAEADRVVVIDPATNQIVAQVQTGYNSYPWRVRLSPDGRELWVSLRNADVVVIYETENFQEIARLTGFRQPADIAFFVPPTLEDLLEQLGLLVEGLEDDGSVNQGQARALLVKLATANEQLARGNVRPATNALNAFMNQVNAFMRGRRPVLTAAEGQQLLDAAQSIVDLLANQ